MIHLPAQFEQIIADIPAKVPRLRHVNPDRILVMVQKMGVRKQGQNAGLRHARNGRVFTPQFPDVSHYGRDIRYVISFNPHICMDGVTDCDDPLEVVMHELWHIGTKCDGKLRRMKHGRQFNQIVSELVEVYRRNGGEELPKITAEDRIQLRYWKRRQSPTIAYVRNSLIARKLRELTRIDWKGEWTEEDVIEKSCRAASCLPKRIMYVCPFGHEVASTIRFKKKRSCAQCSKTFHQKYLLTEKSESRI